MPLPTDRPFAVSARAAFAAAASFLAFSAAAPAFAQDVTTDNPDYYPGDVVVITGTGFQPGERVSLRLDQHPTLHDPYVFYSTVDSTGAFRNADYTVEQQDLGTSFDLTATGLTSGLIATTFFTDSPKVGSVSVVPLSGAMCSNTGGSVSYAVAVNRGSGGGSSGNFTANLSVTTALPPGVTATFSPNPVAFTPSQTSRSTTLTLSASGAVPAGSTGFTVQASTSASDFATGTELLQIDQAPTVTPPAAISRSNDAGQCGAIVSFAATATGMPAPTLTYAPAPGTLFPVGTTTVTATATNSCGSASATFAVTVVDTEKPTVTVADLTRTTDAGVCSATIASLGASAADNCAVATLVGTRSDAAAIAAPFPKGTTTITWVATDTHGNSASATQQVTVNDAENPTITAPAALNLATGPGATACGLLVSDAVLGSPAANDNCGVSVTRTGVPAGNLFPVGTTTLTYTATDPSGNTAVATQAVTVADTTPPVVTTSALAFDTHAGTCAAAVASLQTTAADNCGVSGLVGTRSDAAALNDPFPAGVTTITWVATDVHGNTSSATQTVTVTDHELPAITTADLSVSNDPGVCAATVSLATTATDNCAIATLAGTRGDGLPLTDPFPKGTTTVSWLATDVHGNTTSATQHVTVNDTENPTITAPAPLNLTTGPSAAACGVLVSDGALGSPTAHDNCGVTVERTGVPAGNFFPVGLTTITYTATDPSGNTAVATQTVTVVDNTPPTVTVGNFNLATDPGACSASIVSLGASANDNCGIDTFGGSRSDGFALGQAFPAGVTTITWVATDVHGNTSSATQTVTVTDHELPAITTADLSVSNDPGVCAATVSLATTATDNCAIATLAGTRGDGLPLTDPFPKGTTTVSWLATDVHGNTSTATQRVTVNDTEIPTVTAPAALILTTGAGATACGLLVSDGALGSPTAHDNCGVTVERTGVPAGNFFPVGLTTITYTATDPSGNTAVATQSVTVADDTPPTITVGNLDLATDHGACTASIGSLGASASDNCGIDTFTGTRSDGAAITDPFPKGATTIQWLATDVHGNTQTATQTVTVTDHENPTVTLADLSVSTDAGSCAATIASLGAAAADNCGVASLVGIRSDGLPLADPFPQGTTTISWIATDTSGNGAGATQHVMVADTEHPTLTAPASLNLTTGPGSQTCGVGVGNAALGTPVAQDNCGVTVSVDGIPAGNLFPVGMTTITYTATDPSGNTMTATQTVTVVDDTPPTIAGGESTHLTSGSCGATIAAFGTVSGDNCGVASVVGVRSDGLSLSDPFPVGLTTITWTATDVHGNMATGTSRIHVEDHEAPSIAAPAAVQAATGSGARICGAVISDATLGQPTASDNCSFTLTRSGVPDGNLFPTGATTITWTATDPSGNAASATQLVTVADDTPPTLTVPAAVSVGTGPGAAICGRIVTDAMLGAATASDNCSAALTRTGVPAGNLFPTGTTTITYTATDPSGNTASATQSVTVVDTTPPSITSGNITRATDAGLCSAAIASLGASATDNCGAPTLTSARSDTRSLTDPFPKGVTTILWTATDAAGNTTTATQTVTVTNAAPLAEITAPASGFVVPVGTPVTLSGAFTDDAGDVHTASWTCDALTCASSVNEGSRTASGSVTFATAGVYRIQLVVTDQCGVASTASQVGGMDAMVVVYDPNAGFVTGGGWIQSPAGAYAPNPALAGRANFGFVSKYKKGQTVPTGETEFQFKTGDVDFHSASYDWLVISGARAQYKGTGTINGAGNFGFLLSAVDGETSGGGGKDKFRMKITDKASGQIVYDNMMGAPDSSAAATLLGGGSIAIQANGGKASASIGASLDGTASAAIAPEASGLSQNRPNPFNPETTLRFTLARSGRATLRVFDARGALVRTLVNGQLEPGAHEARWNGMNEHGGRVPSGVYYALFASDGARDRIRMVLIK